MGKVRIVIFLAIGFIIYNILAESSPNRRSTTKQSNTNSTILSWQQEPKEGVEIAENKIAKNYYIVLDGSGSMAEKGCSGNLSKSQASKHALEQFSNLLPNDINIGLATFDQAGIRELLPIGAHSRKAFMDKVRGSKPGGDTPLNSAIKAAVRSLEIQGQKQLGYGEYTLLVVTDGEASPNEDPSPVVEYILRNTPIKLQTIGFCIGQNHSLNQPGRTSYQTAQSVEQLISELGNVLAEAEQFDQSTFSKVP